MPRSKERNAEYMRAYRARKQAGDDPSMADLVSYGVFEAPKRIKALEEEVRHLKEELAKRPHFKAQPIPPTMTNAVARGSGPEGRGVSGFNTRPFTPVPKKGHG